MNPTVRSVNASPQKGTSKLPVGIGQFNIGHGMAGDGHAGPWHRQVSIFSLASLEGLADEARLAVDLTFSENITIDGIVIHTLPIGTRIAIGEAVFAITQIGKPFERDPATHTPREVIMHAEGVFATVEAAGEVKVGDPVRIL